MYFTHADAIWSLHPRLRALAISVDHIRAVENDEGRLADLAEKVERRLVSAAESEMPEIASWREAFSRMGMKPTQYRCASEALLRRYRKDGSIPRLHPLVDYLNFVSMSFAIPIAVFDSEKIGDGITVRPADGSETYQTFQGEIEHPQPGETIFADPDGNAHSRRWTHRQSARSVVTPYTDRVLIVAEALHADASGDLDALEDELKSGLADAGACILVSRRLSVTERRLEF